MVYHSLKLFIISIRKNRLFHLLNLTGFISGFLLITIIFTFVHQELSFDRFHTNADKIVRIHSKGYGVTPLCFADKLKNKIPEISGIIRFSKTNLSIKNGKTKTELKNIHYTDPEIFQIFSFRLLSGNISTVLQNPYSIVLDESTAIKLFGNTNVIGKTITNEQGKNYTITGIMENIPKNSHIQSQAFISMETFRLEQENRTFDCGSWGHLTYLHLSGQSDYKTTEKKINVVLEDSRMGSKEAKFILKLQPLLEIYFDGANNKYDGSIHGNKQTVFIYLAIAMVILLIVITNSINLSLGILGSRAKETAIRKIHGVKKSQIILQILIESCALSFFTFIVAIIFIESMLPELSSFLNLPISPSIDRLWLYVYFFIGFFAIGLITGIIPGILLSNVDELKILKKQTFFRPNAHQQSFMLVLQLTIVAVLVNSTFTLKNQIDYLIQKDLGFNSKDVVYFSLNEHLVLKKEILKDILLKDPNIKSVSFSSGLVIDNFAKAIMESEEMEKICNFYSADPNFLKLYEIKLKNGRNFSWDLKTDIKNSCIVNEETCKVFGLTDPINKKIGGKTIVGVVEDFNFSSLHNKVEALVIHWWNDNENTAQLKISEKSPDKTLAYIHKTCKEISPDYENNTSYVTHRIDSLYKSEKALKQSLGVYSIVTFIIALLGLFSMTLFTIKKKTKEISLRKLFGANLYSTLRLLSRTQVLIVVISNGLAFPISYLLMEEWLNNFQYKTDFDLMTLIKTFLITLVFTVVTILFIIIKTHSGNLISNFRQE